MSKRKPVTEELMKAKELPDYKKILRAAILEETSLLMEKHKIDIIKKAEKRVEMLLKAQAMRKS